MANSKDPVKKIKVPQNNIPDSVTQNKYKPPYMINFRKQLHLDEDTRLNQDHLKFLANLLEQWVDNDLNAIDLKTFRRWHHFSDYSNFNKLVKRHKYLERAFDYAKLSIAENRERLALFKEIEPKIFAFMQHNYDPQWASAEVRHADLRKVEESDNTTKVVVLEKYKDEIDSEKKG